MIDLVVRLLTALILGWNAPAPPAPRATVLPYPTIAPATPGPSPTREAAYPAPYPAPRAAAADDPHLAARWDGPGAASISWQQQSRGCLSVTHATGERAFIGCYDGQGRVIVTLGKVGPVDASVRPAAGDVYNVRVDGQTYSAPLQSVAYLPLMR